MNCTETHERLVEWLTGHLSAAETVTVEHHIEACSECRAEADVLRATRTAFSPAALGERVEPNWAAMRARIVRAAREEQEAPGLIGRARAWLAEIWEVPRLKPALATAAVLVVCVMGLYLTVGPYLAGPQRVSTLASLTVDELATLSEALSIEGDGDLLGAEPVDAETLRELATLPPDELDRLLKTL